MRFDITYEFKNSCISHGQICGIFGAKSEAGRKKDKSSYLVEESIIRQRFKGASQFEDAPVLQFDEVDISEHDLIRALRACRDLRERKLLKGPAVSQ